MFSDEQPTLRQDKPEEAEPRQKDKGHKDKAHKDKAHKDKSEKESKKKKKDKTKGDNDKGKHHATKEGRQPSEISKKPQMQVGESFDLDIITPRQSPLPLVE